MRKSRRGSEPAISGPKFGNLSLTVIDADNVRLILVNGMYCLLCCEIGVPHSISELDVLQDSGGGLILQWM